MLSHIINKRKLSTLAKQHYQYFIEETFDGINFNENSGQVAFIGMKIHHTNKQTSIG